MIGMQSHLTEFPDYMRRSDAADYLRTFYALPCRHATLAKLAVAGGGPPFRKAGRYPVYLRADLDAWARQRLGIPRVDRPGVARQIHSGGLPRA